MMDVVIIGGGVVGATIARKLSQYNLKIMLIEKEKDIASGATKANSAIVHGGYAESSKTLKGRLCYQGRKQFKNLDRELNFGYKEIGSLVIAFEEKQLEDLELLLKNGQANGLKDLKILRNAEIMKIEPNINKEVKYALYCKGAGICSPYQLAHAMMENAIQNGVELRLNSEVLKIKKEDNYIVYTGEEKIKTKYIINSAGINSEKISKMVGESDVFVKPRSGQYILFNTQSGEHLNHTIFQTPTELGKGILVTKTVHGNLLIGPDALDEEKENKNTDLKRLEKVFNAALLSFPELDVNLFARSFAGVRAVSSTNDFIIKESEKAKNFINLLGIQSPGLTSSPAIAEMVLEILKNTGINLEEKLDFNPNRREIIGLAKKNIPNMEIAALVNKEEGNQDRIVCRCERVSEKTMKDALDRGVDFTTIDGMKRRTRAGMGLCQGGFCRERVTSFMDRELGKSFEDRTDIEIRNAKRVTRKEFLDYYKKEK